MGKCVRRSLRWVGQLLDDMNTKNTGVLAAGAAYFAVLAFFPLVAAAVAIAALIIGPGHVDVVTAGLGHYVPRDIASLLTTQIELASNQPSGSIAVAVIAIILAIFWASGFIENLARALGAVYGLRETRHPLRIKARSMGLYARRATNAPYWCAGSIWRAGGYCTGYSSGSLARRDWCDAPGGCGALPVWA